MVWCSPSTQTFWGRAVRVWTLQKRISNNLGNKEFPRMDCGYGEKCTRQIGCRPLKGNPLPHPEQPLPINDAGNSHDLIIPRCGLAVAETLKCPQIGAGIRPNVSPPSLQPPGQMGPHHLVDRNTVTSSTDPDSPGKPTSISAVSSSLRQTHMYTVNNILQSAALIYHKLRF
jgi:hypothetical protein